MPATRWPTWWEWEIDLTLHAENRMEQRGITDVELRHVLENATTLARASLVGRWIATGRRRRERWCVVLEPDAERRRVVVVTVYKVG